MRSTSCRKNTARLSRRIVQCVVVFVCSDVVSACCAGYLLLIEHEERDVLLMFALFAARREHFLLQALVFGLQLHLIRLGFTAHMGQSGSKKETRQNSVESKDDRESE